ncbi:hypothetical protein PFICI_04227 [Pestalotiopsis fici W106-1]|uniref:DAGKc domain-containing protein n=1 Tax=Pestalotiopsis fici (strain W106-1 / CGMCC3.15140) TaxID=1229662 RepID=W3XB01_PESFW|nr:uncharacterized protein PFICI_04227 [Pestalotiopsis fici W106-1]ETS82351.1 hypothetical protein PFICI_04227 [Pestalotiopsis fici W106-1]
MATDGHSTAAGQATPDQSHHLPTHQIVYINKDSASGGRYNIFSITEDLNNEEKPFNLTKSQVEHVPQPLLAEFLQDGPPDYLRDAADKKVHVVVSTGSGTGLASKFYNFVLRPLLQELGLSERQSAGSENGSPYALLITQDAQSIQRFARDLNISSKVSDGSLRLQHTVILLSGDGGAIELLNGKAPGDDDGERIESPSHASLPLVAMLPLGTGNGLFHSVHKPLYAETGDKGPSSLVLGLRTLLRGQARPLPSFKVDFSAGSRTIVYKASGAIAGTDGGAASEEVEIKEESDTVSHLYGAIVASYGFHSQLVWESDTPEYRKHGSKRFQMVAAELLKENHAYSASVELTVADGTTRTKIDRQKHAYILSTPLSDLEKTFTISPASKPLDGVLRLVHFGPTSPEKTMEIMMAAYNNGSHVGMTWEADDGKTEQIGYDAIHQVRVTTQEENPRWRKVCIDGTIVEIPQGGTMTVTKEERPHLRLLVHPSIVG